MQKERRELNLNMPKRTVIGKMLKIINDRKIQKEDDLCGCSQRRGKESACQL